MVGALSVVDSHTGPCLCSTSMNMKSGGELVSQMKRKQGVGRAGWLELGSSFVDSCHDWRLSSKMIPGVVNKKSSRKARTLVVVNELGGQYEETFGDVKTQLVNYFTYKAVRTVLTQLYEMNPPKYTWFYQYVASNQPTDGKRFLRTLGKENQELAERVMITRLHLYGKWIKKCDHAQIYKEISDENLELMRERLMETVVWPSDDSNTDTIGYVLTFSLGAGPVPALLLPEIFASRFRAKALALSLCMHWISNFIIGLYFLSVVDKVEISVVYLVFATVCLLVALYIAGNIVETKG